MIDFEFDKEENNKDKFIRIVRMLKTISDETKEQIIKCLESKDFFTAPASSKFHNNFEGGLCDHSLKVAKILQELTIKNDIKWDNEESPIIVGLFHDLCKMNMYEPGTRNVKEKNEFGKDVWVSKPTYQIKDSNVMLGIHGDRSVTMLLLLRISQRDFTTQELACIRYHMGDTQEGEGKKFHEAAAKDVAIFWTHVADNLATLSEKII